MALFLTTGYHRYKNDVYWENADDCSVRIVASTSAQASIHRQKEKSHMCSNATRDTDDKLHKVRRNIDTNSKPFQIRCTLVIQSHHR
jgi:hypothetical protein